MTARILPVHPITGRTALGWRKPRPGEDPDDLFPIWPIVGAAPGDDDDPDGEEADDPDGQGDGTGDGDGGQDGEDDPDGADQLGDAGKQALDRMKERWRQERERRKAAETERDQLKGAGGDANDPERIRSEAAAAATSKANARIVRSEIRAAAAGKLTNPRDALAFLDPGQFEVDDDGQVDEDEIADAIENLLKERPYLGVAAKAPEPRFQGTGDGGARKGTGGPKQLTQRDLKSMSPEAIEQARVDGKLDDLMGGK